MSLTIHASFSIEKCIKCGMPRQYFIADNNFDLHYYAPKTGWTDVDIGVLWVKCKNCGYGWAEHTKDYIEPEKVVVTPKKIEKEHCIDDGRDDKGDLENVELTPEQEAEKEIEELNLTALESGLTKVKQRRGLTPEIFLKIVAVASTLGAFFAILMSAR